MVKIAMVYVPCGVYGHGIRAVWCWRRSPARTGHGTCARGYCWG